MSSPPRQLESLPRVEECEAGPPSLIAIDHVPEAARARLAGSVEEAGCKLFSATSGPEGSYVIAGHADPLGRLRGLLVPIRALDAVRERVERELAHLAAPDGLPQLREEGQKKTEVADEIPVEPGTTLRVSREFTFDAAHNLPRYNGKCERLHGHTFRLLVTLDAPLDTWSGMAFDFSDLKRAVQERVLRVLDHSYLNEIVANPSAEFLAVWIWRELADLPLHEVKVWETPKCSVTYHGPPSRSPERAATRD